MKIVKHLDEQTETKPRVYLKELPYGAVFCFRSQGTVAPRLRIPHGWINLSSYDIYGEKHTAWQENWEVVIYPNAVLITGEADRYFE